MRITRIYTDASAQRPQDRQNPSRDPELSQQSTVSAVFWHPELRFEEHAFRLDKAQTSGKAELQAIYYALAALNHSSDACFLYTDCLGAMMALTEPVYKGRAKKLVELCQQLMEEKKVAVLHCPRSMSVFNSRANHLCQMALKDKDPTPLEQYIQSFIQGISGSDKEINDLGIVVPKNRDSDLYCRF